RIPRPPGRGGGRPAPHRLGSRTTARRHGRLGAVPRRVAQQDGLDRLLDETAGGGRSGRQPRPRLRRDRRRLPAAGAGRKRAPAAAGDPADRAMLTAGRGPRGVDRKRGAEGAPGGARPFFHFFVPPPQTPCAPGAPSADAVADTVTPGLKQAAFRPSLRSFLSGPWNFVSALARNCRSLPSMISVNVSSFGSTLLSLPVYFFRSLSAASPKPLTNSR